MSSIKQVNLANIDEVPNIELDFKLCILCQKVSKDHIIDPRKIKLQSDTNQGYKSLATNLSQFVEIDSLSCPKLVKIVNDHEENLEVYLRVHEVKWHRNCRLKYNNQELRRVLKRKSNQIKSSGDQTTPKSPNQLSTQNNNDFIETVVQNENILDNEMEEVPTDHENNDMPHKISAQDANSTSKEYDYECIADIALNKVVELIKLKKEESSQIVIFKLSELHTKYLSFFGDGDVFLSTIPNGQGQQIRP